MATRTAISLRPQLPRPAACSAWTGSWPSARWCCSASRAAAVLASRQPVLPAALGALAPIGAPKPAPALRDVPLVGTATPTDPAALRTAVNEAIDRLFDERQTARLRRYLRGPPIRRAERGVEAVRAAAVSLSLRRARRGCVDAALPLGPTAPGRRAEPARRAARARARTPTCIPTPARSPSRSCTVRAPPAPATPSSTSRSSSPRRTQADRRTSTRVRPGGGACPSDPTALWLYGQWLSVRTDTRAPRRSRARSRCSRACNGAFRARRRAGLARPTRC